VVGRVRGGGLGNRRWVLRPLVVSDGGDDAAARLERTEARR